MKFTFWDAFVFGLGFQCGVACLAGIAKAALKMMGKTEKDAGS